MKLKYIIFISIAMALISGCGEVSVDVDEDTYNPKIVVDAYIFPEYGVDNVRITRNYALNTEIDLNEFILTDADVQIKDMESATTYVLEFNPIKLNYEYSGNDLVIEYGKKYQLSVNARIDGQDLQTTSITTVPEKGFEILEEKSSLQPLRYQEENENGTIQKFRVRFNRSPDVDSYLISIVALDASEETFVNDNIFGVDIEDIIEENDIDLFKYQGQWQLTELGEGESEFTVEWFSVWFYGRYEIIIYAADENYTDYFLTHNQIQDIDGNLWEPKFNFEGDGIGVFGACVPDTTYFEVIED